MNEENALAKPDDMSLATQTIQTLTHIDWANIDADKAKVLVDMQERMIKRQAEESFNRAFAEMQPELPVIERDGTIVVKGKIRSRYATYEAIMETIAEPLRRFGFALSFNTPDTGDSAFARITCKLRHKDGHSEPYEIRLPIERTDFRSAAQDVHSTISFGKRVLLKDVLNIVEKGEGADAPKQLAFVTEDQVHDLETMLQDTNSDTNRFLAYFGIQKLADLSVKDHREALSMLQTKLNRQKVEPPPPPTEE